jgi:hypothetical protein
MAVPHPWLWEKSAASIGSNGSTSSGDFSEIEAAIHRLCDARGDDDGNRAALLSTSRSRNMRPHPTPKIRDEGLRGASKMMDDNLSVFGKIVEIVRPLLHHTPALGKVLGVVVGGADFIAFVMGKLAFDPIGMEPDFV